MKTTSGAVPWALAMVLVGCVGCGGGGSSATATATTESPEALPAKVSIRTFQDGSILGLERNASGQRSRIAVDTRRGGMISEASLDGINFVNSHDTGRGVQLALYDGAYRYDGCAGCSGSWGWNPVQGGDQRNRGSTVLATSVEAGAITVRTRALEWMASATNPDEAVPSDAVMTQRISSVDGDPRAWRIDYRIDIDGSASHQVALQELPSVYAGSQYQRLLTYGGKAPWTRGEVSETIPLPLGQTPVRRFSAELWFSLVDDNGAGITVFAPGSNPYVSGFLAPGSGGPAGSAAAFARFDAPLALRGGRPIVGRYYLIAGDWRQARETVYRLRLTDEGTDVAAPRLALDRPAVGATVSGTVNVAGWAYDNRRMASVTVFVDGDAAGTATLGGARADVAQVYEDAPADSGFGLALATQRWTNGAHTVSVVATDAAGNASEAHAEVVIAN